MAKPEGVFLTELGKSFDENGVFFFKIPDMPHFYGQGTKFDIKKPFDAIACYLGIPIAIEAKYLRDFRTFGIKQLSENQIEGLDKFENSPSNGKSFIFLNIRHDANKFIAKSRTNSLVILPWCQFRQKGRYSKLELLQFPRIEGRKSRYDISEFLVNLAISTL